MFFDFLNFFKKLKNAKTGFGNFGNFAIFFAKFAKFPGPAKWAILGRGAQNCLYRRHQEKKVGLRQKFAFFLVVKNSRFLADFWRAALAFDFFGHV